MTIDGPEEVEAVEAVADIDGSNNILRNTMIATGLITIASGAIAFANLNAVKHDIVSNATNVMLGSGGVFTLSYLRYVYNKWCR